ncbi:MAG: hypothetical protein H0T11_05325 [Chthoniobacterales bacterium]|nr:hypothetical protein [Chthoniobacterales bacterium]
MCHTEERREIQPRAAAWLPRDRRTEDEAVRRIVTRVFVGEVVVKHLGADFQRLIVRQREHDALCNAPFAAAIAGEFLLDVQSR